MPTNTDDTVLDRGAATRAALVQTATEMFVEDGYGAVSVRDLARRTGLTTGAIYGHYRNKADLLAAAVHDRIERELESPATGKGAGKGAATRAGGLQASIGRQWKTYRARSAMRALLVEGAAAARVDPDVRTKLSATLEGKLAEWRTVYRHIQTDEGLDPDVDMESLVFLLFSAELGLGVLESIGVDLPKPAAWERTIERLLGAVYPMSRTAKGGRR
jgi:AcrR family transcriptional regulator